jgi:hypothetical protein
VRALYVRQKGKPWVRTGERVGKEHRLSERKRKVELSKNRRAVLKGDETRAVKKWRKNYFALSERWREIRIC